MCGQCEAVLVVDVLTVPNDLFKCGDTCVADLKSDLQTCGLLSSNPHVRSFLSVDMTVSQGSPAMQAPVSKNVSPHVRDYLRADEAKRLIIAAGKAGRQPLRDVVLLTLIYRHGLRVSEAVNARWVDFDLDSHGPKTMHVHRLKGSIDSTHTLDRDEVAGLRRLRDQNTDRSPHLFLSERGGPLSPDMVARIVTRASTTAKIGFHVHPHMLRHSAGYALANEGLDTRLIQEFLGHASINNTTRYTKIAPQRLAAVRVR